MMPGRRKFVYKVTIATAAPSGRVHNILGDAIQLSDLPTGIPGSNLASDFVTVNTGPGLAGGGIIHLGGGITVSLTPSGVVPGPYTNANISVNAYGQVTSASNGSSGGGGGTQGPQGDPGPKGDKGDKGDQGIQGIPGEQGNPGPKGDQGIKGDTGDQGIPGPSGGPPGPKGDKGDQGIPGSPGGATGPKGDKGDQGIQGVPGDQGIQGIPGGGGGSNLFPLVYNALPLIPGPNGGWGGALDLPYPPSNGPFIELCGSNLMVWIPALSQWSGFCPDYTTAPSSSGSGSGSGSGSNNSVQSGGMRSAPVLKAMTSVKPDKTLSSYLPGEKLECGVVIGSYSRWPSLIELQLRVIRKLCGTVPVLIADDYSPCSNLLQEIASRHEGVTYWSNPSRIGHAGGDLSSLWKGVVWAQGLNLKVIAKLSQRFLVINPTNWLQDSARELLESRLPLATRKCKGTENFPLRTEAMLLEVSKWGEYGPMSELVPRITGGCAEYLINSILHRYLGGTFHPWSLLQTEERYQKTPNVLWHCANSLENYLELANEYEITLPEDFHVDGWENDAKNSNYLPG